MLEPTTRSLFFFEPGITYLNHGGFGVTPIPVMEERIRQLARIEAAPGAFVVNEHRAAWQRIAAMVAARFAARPEDVALIDNTTDGINAILRSFPFQPGDEILVTTLTYGSIAMVAEHVAKTFDGKVNVAPLRFPQPDPQQCVEAVAAAITPRTRVAILDHITSATSLVLPIAAMAEACRKQGVAVLVDAAHVPGNIEFDIAAIQPDWYVCNLHKWYFAPRACGFLWAAPQRQAGLVPTVLSWDIGRPFPNSFEWTGTRDTSAWLSIPAAFAFMDRFGEDAVRTHNHRLIRDGIALLADAWRFKPETPPEMIGSSTLVPLPKTLPFEANDEGRGKFQKTLWDSYGIEASASFIHDGQTWLRISAQIYNELDDYQRLANAVLEMTTPTWQPRRASSPARQP